MGRTRVLSTEFPWVTVFMDVALRAIREAHHAYGRWVVGQHWRMNPTRSARINKGPGLALADERTVCSAISQEFLASGAVGGIWEDGDRYEIRFFDIRRETQYRSDKRKKVDLFIKKYVPRGESLKLELVKKPSFMEAKRVRLWYPDLESSAENIGALQVGDTRSDVTKLRKEKRFREKRGKQLINAHILVWGVYSAKGGHDSPTELLERLNDKGLTVRAIRSFPIDWTEPSLDKPFRPPTLTRVLWVLLVEVDAETVPDSGSVVERRLTEYTIMKPSTRGSRSPVIATLARTRL